MKKYKKKNKKNNTPMYLVLAGGILLLFAGVMLSLQDSGSSPQPAAIVDSHEEETYPEIPRISIGEAKTAIDEGSVVVLDVRDAESYAISHMPGAINIPTNELASRLGELDKSAWIITYCTWPSEESSARAARILLDAGFENVNPILGGFRLWLEAGYSVEPW